MNIQDTIFTIFDTETTGFHPKKGDRIIEIAAIKMKGTEILGGEVFESLVNPERENPYESAKINKITNEMLVDAPKIFEVLPNFFDFVGNSILVAHNAEFDVSFLEEELFLTNPFMQVPETICTKLLSRKISPSEKFHNLDTLSYRYNITMSIDGNGRHRAMTDVLLLAKIFIKLIETGKIETLEELRRMGK